MSQSKVGSFVEACLNTASGFVVSYFMWPLVITPLFHFHITHTENLKITAIFTVVSVLRSYLWRRIFNRRGK